MRVLALDIWQDLRQKRLWPVALGLLVAIVAVGALALRPGSSEPVAPPGVATPAAGTTPGADLRLTDEPLGGSSDLEGFKARDPFAGGAASAAGLDAAGAAAAGAIAGSGVAGSPAAGLAGTDDLSSGSVASGSTPSTGSGGSSGATGVPTAPSGSGGSGSSGGSDGGSDKRDRPRKQAEPEIRYFTHAVDVVFGRVGSTERHRLETLDHLPKNDPFLLFAGVSVDGKIAAFSVLHPALDVEGKCFEPHGSCSLLLLKKGDERRLTDPDTGHTYKLVLRGIEQVRVKG